MAGQSPEPASEPTNKVLGAIIGAIFAALSLTAIGVTAAGASSRHDDDGEKHSEVGDLEEDHDEDDDH
ncbi:MAG: hypothetical protein ACN4GZ_20110 [Acidimicrobiales bacterium]